VSFRWDAKRFRAPGRDLGGRFTLAACTRFDTENGYTLGFHELFRSHLALVMKCLSRSIAGWLRFLTLIQNFCRPPR
jgi:hypothetical protein